MLFLVVEAVEQVPPPAPGPVFHIQNHVHIGPRRQPQQQPAAQRPPPQGEQVLPRLQKAEEGPAPPGPPGPAAAPRPGAQGQLVPGIRTAHPHADAAAGIPGQDTEILAVLPLPPQAEEGSCGYCSIFALTRYWPPTTPPKRYFPSVLVLVVAIRVSVAVAPVPVT